MNIALEATLKTIMIEFKQYEKGDRVQTPMGPATVAQTETFTTENDLLSRLVMVNYDGAIRNDPVPIDPDLIVSMDDWEMNKYTNAH